jgi:hypothetical protein
MLSSSPQSAVPHSSVSAPKILTLEFDQAVPVMKILQSKTAQKILEHLASKSLTMTELSHFTKTPLPTIQYNIDQLLQAKLIQSDAFHYSSKGKKVSHFSLTHQYIVISPKKQSFAQELSWIVPSLFAGVVVFWQSQQTSIPLVSTLSATSFADSAQPVSDVADSVAQSAYESAPMAMRAIEPVVQTASSVDYSSALWFSVFVFCAVAILFILTRYLVNRFSRKSSPVL